MKKKKPLKILFKDIYKQIRKPLPQPDQFHIKEKKQDRINDIKYKEQIDD